MSDRWLTFVEAREIIKICLTASLGRSEAVLKAARTSGEVRNRGKAMLANDDGLMNWHSRVEPSDKELLFSHDDLLDWLTRQPEESKPSAPPPEHPSERRAGRPAAYDWQAIGAETFKLMSYHGEFSTDDPAWNAQARLEEALNDKFGVSISTLRERLPKLLQEWRKSMVGN
jgi:hypothetical protein